MIEANSKHQCVVTTLNKKPDGHTPKYVVLSKTRDAAHTVPKRNTPSTVLRFEHVGENIPASFLRNTLLRKRMGVRDLMGSYTYRGIKHGRTALAALLRLQEKP